MQVQIKATKQIYRRIFANRVREKNLRFRRPAMHGEPPGRVDFIPRKAGYGALAVIFLIVLFLPAARAALDSETQFVLNTFSFLVWGALVMWMCGGFTMLESGSVRKERIGNLPEEHRALLHCRTGILRCRIQHYVCWRGRW